MRVAAVDCGTNSLRLLIADLPDGGSGPVSGRGGRLVDVVRRMEIVRLGQGVDRTGRLAPEAIGRAEKVLTDYARQIDALGATRVRMVATSASRDAENADDFRSMVRATLGVAPEVISGDEEARLSFAGAVAGLPPRAVPPYLAVDIGGGSTEFVLGTVAAGTGLPTVDAAVSVDIGCVRMTERHLHDDPPTPEQVVTAEADIGAAVGRALAEVSGRTAGTFIGLAGTVTTMAAIALGLSNYDPDRSHHARVPAADIDRVAGELLAMNRRERLALPVMHPGRADVIGGGALILRTIMRLGGFDSVVASEHDILDGIAYGLGTSGGR